MRALLLLALLELSLPCLAQNFHPLPQGKPSTLFFAAAATHNLAFDAPPFALHSWAPSRTPHGNPACKPIELRPLFSSASEQAFALSPSGCPAPKLQWLAATQRPLVATWPEMQFKNTLPESPWPSLQTIYLTSNTSLRFSHGLQLRMILK